MRKLNLELKKVLNLTWNGGYKFERGKKVFDKFVREVYNEKDMLEILLLEILVNYN